MCRLVKNSLTAVKDKNSRKQETAEVNQRMLTLTQQDKSPYEDVIVRKKLNEKSEIDKVDLQILSILQENSRLSLRKIADKMHISGVIAASRIKNLENKGILKGYTAILDPVKLGFDLTAVIFIQTEGGYIKNLENELSQMANVIAIYEITGDFDVVAVVKLKDRDSLNSLLKNLLVTPHIKKTMTDITLNVVKEDFKIKL
jgi:Lrp/AsnC family transcriptional regulator for asnA, asnC and gidA